MDTNRFDLLTRQLAGGVSRRQVLKGIFSFAIGSVLAGMGFKREANAYAGPIVVQQDGEAIFMPHLAKVCEEASSCGEREGKACGAFPNCFCIESTEGEIRCGKTPSTCHVPLCESSADCAHLGEGYFCDVPFSGCCTDPPASLSRCIAPCNNECPEENQCGSKCCGNGQTCSDGVCVSSYDCELDAITITTMRDALAKLEAGESVAHVSPQGCIKVRQEVVEGEVVSKSFEVANRQVLRWNMVGNQWIGESDADRDGFYEWSSVTTYGEAEGDFETVVTEYATETKKPARRTTNTPQGDDIHVVVEEADDSGKLQVVNEYLTPSVLVAKLDDTPGARVGEYTPLQSETCEGNPCDPERLKQRMELGVDRASTCLTAFGDRGLEFYLKAYNTLQRRMTFRCESIPGDPEAAIGNWADQRARLVVIVDPVKYCALSDEGREWVLFHEILHASIPVGHDPAIEALHHEQRKQLDRVYGCMALCYNNVRKGPTKCMCAQCFGTVTCDPLCEAFNSDCGATCPCPGVETFYYDTCFDCLAGCPSGLTCFNYHNCDPVGHSPICSPLPTCP